MTHNDILSTIFSKDNQFFAIILIAAVAGLPHPLLKNLILD